MLLDGTKLLLIPATWITSNYSKSQHCTNLYITSFTTALSSSWINSPLRRVALDGRTRWRVGVLSVERCLVASSKGCRSWMRSSRSSECMLLRKRSSLRWRRILCSLPDFRALFIDWSIRSLEFHLVSIACFSVWSSSFCNLKYIK